MPKVSIVLPTYNGSHYIRESIDSIMNQTFEDWELIIVNDCSTDETPKIIDEYMRKDSRIRVINNDVNQKLPRSLNIGFRKANGRLITWTSDDNYYLKNAIEKMVSFLEKDLTYPMVCTAMDYINSNGDFIKRSNQFDMPRMYFEDRVGACFMYRDTVIKDIGEYDPEWFMVEDYEYWYRIMEHYGKIGYIPECLYKYRIHDNSLTGTNKPEIAKLHLKLLETHLDTIVERLVNEKTYLTEIYYTLYENGLDEKKLKEKFTKKLNFLDLDGHWDAKKKTIVYGAGNFGDKAYQMLGDNICFYADANTERHGKVFNGLKIISPEEMMDKLDQYNICVAVSAIYMYEVVSMLSNMGLNEFCSVYFLRKEPSL